MKKMNKYVSLGLLLVMAVALGGAPASALSGYLSSFESTYSSLGVSGSRIDNCNLCHVNPNPYSDSTRNSYGLDFSVNGHNFATIEGNDPDTDGFTSIAEITAKTFPGNHSDHPILDITPPETTITGSPPTISNSNSATFTFSSTEVGSTFKCKLDGGALTACTSPTSYTRLADGSHTFQVNATDAAGNPDLTPASYTWTVDTIPPDTTIDSSPPAISTSNSATFTFSSTETVSTFKCKLDGGALTACSSPASYTGLADGSHTFEVTATDAAGNPDLTPASYTWTVNTATPPPPTPVYTVIVLPDSPSIVAGTTQQFSVQIYQDGVLTDPAGAVVTWRSSSKRAGSIDSNGLFTASTKVRRHLTTTITANVAISGVTTSNSTTLTITPKPR